MGFSRSFLKATGLSDEQITAVIEEHTAVTDALKSERDKFKEQASKAADLQKQLDGMKGGEDWKQKFEDEHKAFEDFKKQTAQDAETAKVKAAYRKLLAEEGISEKRLDSIMKVTDLSKMKLDKDGNLTNIDDLKKAISDEWGEFKTTVIEKGAKVETPPRVDNGKMSMSDIYKTDEHGRYVLSTEERQKAIAENLKNRKE